MSEGKDLRTVFASGHARAEGAHRWMAALRAATADYRRKWYNARPASAQGEDRRLCRRSEHDQLIAEPMVRR